MKRTEVKSSNVKSVGYDLTNKILEVEFHSGGIYHYLKVPEDCVQDLARAKSVGKFISSEIKGNFEFVKGEYEKSNIFLNIYFAGPAGAGKTYAAKYLIEKYGYIQAKIANPVYGLAKDYFGMTKKDRKLLQIIGTEAARQVVDTNIWVNRFAQDIKIVNNTRKLMGFSDVGFVCDDCRFLNEHKSLKENGWIGIYLNVSDEARIERLTKRDGNAQVTTLKHSSELDMDKFKDDLIQFDASGTIEEANKSLDVLIEKLKAEKEKVNG